MSRHRLVRNMNIQGTYQLEIVPCIALHIFLDELDDDAIDDGEDDLSPQDYGTFAINTTSRTKLNRLQRN